MHWAAAARTGREPDEVLDGILEEVAAGLSGGGADLALLFLGEAFVGSAEPALARVREALGGPHVIGCGAGGVIGGGREFEQVPAMSLIAGRMPGALVQGFHLVEADLPDADAPPKAWHEAVGLAAVDQPDFVLVGDPFTLPAERLLQGLDFAYPRCVKVGGLASGAREEGAQVLFHGDHVVREGAVGVALMGDVKLIPAVAQGCRGIGKPLRISSCDGHLLTALDGEPVLDALRATLESATEEERDLARTALHLGFEMDPFEPTDEGPWLIRNLLGIEPRTQGLFVGEPLRKGRRVRFHVRDRSTSAEDLDRTLEHAAGGAARVSEGALLFSCLGRGRQLYGAPHHDAEGFARHFQAVPLGGFFCNGEIGPVGRTTHLHGYTSSFGLIRRRTSNAGSPPSIGGAEA